MFIKILFLPNYSELLKLKSKVQITMNEYQFKAKAIKVESLDFLTI